MNTEEVKAILQHTKAVQDDAAMLYLWLPPEEGLPARRQLILPRSLTKGTKGYIIRVAEQINGSYENGLFDACAVMIRRMIETLLIAAFENHSIGHKIQDPKGDYFHLSKIVPMAIAETHSWKLSRNSKAALPRLKNLGDASAHSPRFNAHRDDIDRLRDDLRHAVQELLSIANLK